MNKTKKTLDERPILYTFLILLIPSLLNGALVLLRAELTDATAILALFYICRLLSLLVGFFGLGCALRACNRGILRSAILYLLVSAGAYGITQLIAAVREILYFVGYEDYLSYALINHLGSALANTILFFLLHGALLILCYFAFFRGKAPLVGELPLFSRRDRRATAAGVATLLLFLYQFIPQLIETIAMFLDEFGPTITQTDIFLIVLGYLFLFLSMFIGYFLLSLVQGYEKQ